MPLLTVTALAETGAAASFDVAAIMQAALPAFRVTCSRFWVLWYPLLSPLSVPVLLSDMVSDG